MQVKVFESVDRLNEFAAEQFIQIGNRAIVSHGTFSVALAGGSTPKALYRLLASGKFKDRIDWKSVFFYFGDERNVPPDDEDSNFRMACENLFKPLWIPENSGHSWIDTNVFRWDTEAGDVKKIAEDYAAAIYAFFALDEKNPFPRFDLVLLGMGDDGHTASLFPYTEALREDKKIAVANRVEKFSAWRFTLTYPVINNAGNVIFLVKGEDKAETLKEVLEGDFQPEKLPSQNVRPAGGNLFWLADSSAAKLLARENQSTESLPKSG